MDLFIETNVCNFNKSHIVHRQFCALGIRFWSLNDGLRLYCNLEKESTNQLFLHFLYKDIFLLSLSYALSYGILININCLICKCFYSVNGKFKFWNYILPPQTILIFENSKISLEAPLKKYFWS